MDKPKNTTDLPPCCQPVKKPEGRNGIFWGILYGILPHTFCIAFIVLSVIGATAGAAFFGKFLALPYFFPALIAMSIVFATISAAFYLNRSGSLSVAGIKRSKKYLAVLYGTTLAVGLVFAYGIFPLVVKSTAPADNPVRAQNTAFLTIQVDIPCPGHAPLIIGELKKISGVENVEFIPPNKFKISYDQSLTTPAAITSLDIFKTYKATIIQ